MRDDDVDLSALEPTQLSAARLKPLARRKLGAGATALLIGLRVDVLIAVPVVIYAFVKALGKG